MGLPGCLPGFSLPWPMIGWICVHTMVRCLTALEGFIPWIALILLAIIGGKMLAEGIRGKDSQEEASKLGLGALLIQGVATSIDALSVGFTIAGYGWAMAPGGQPDYRGGDLCDLRGRGGYWEEVWHEAVRQGPDSGRRDPPCHWD